MDKIYIEKNILEEVEKLNEKICEKISNLMIFFFIIFFQK